MKGLSDNDFGKNITTHLVWTESKQYILPKEVFAEISRERWMLDLLAVTVDYEPLHSGIHVPATTTALEAISYLSATEINSRNNPKSKS